MKLMPASIARATMRVGHRLVDVADMGPDAAATAEGHGAEADFGYEQARTAEGLVAHEDDPS